jgi:hypothetical protein
MNDLAHRRILGLHERSRGFDDYRLIHVSKLHYHVYAHRGFDLYGDLVAGIGLESRFFDLQPVVAGDEIHKPIRTLGGRVYAAAFTGTRTDQRDGRISNHGTRCIGYRADYGSVECLGV